MISWAAVLVVVCVAAELSASTAYGKFGRSVAGEVAIDPRLGWCAFKY